MKNNSHKLLVVVLALILSLVTVILTACNDTVASNSTSASKQTETSKTSGNSQTTSLKSEIGNSQSQSLSSDNGDQTSTDADDPSNPDTGKTQQIYWNKVGAFSTGFSNAEGGVAEIVKYNEDNGKLYLVNGKTQTIDVVTLRNYNDTTELETVFTEDTDRISFNTLVSEHTADFENGFVVGDITSLAINTELDVIAVAVQHADYDKAGAIVLLNYDGSYNKAYPTGIQPDMVTFAGNVVLTADEAEPRLGYATGVDPKGSVTVLDLTQTNPTSTVVTFDKFDAERDSLIANKVLLKKNTAPSVDLEPEYIASSGNFAYVALQEANAIATLDITKKEFVSVKGLGFKDHSVEGNGLDLLDDNTAKIETQAVYGAYMPDGIDVFTSDGKTYVVTANEGDAREWGEYVGVEKFVIGSTKVEVLANSEFDGLEDGKHYVLGGRSFSIFDADDMSLVYDSGDLIEKTIAESEEYKAYFNCSNDKVALDGRSKKKGPEPEAVKVEIIDGKTYAFVALERQGGAMMFDITNTEQVSFVTYANSRDYSMDMAGDCAPESIAFIPSDKSANGQNLLVLANENSGTIAIYKMENEKKSYELHEVFNKAQTPIAQHLIIWSVFGNGGKVDGQTSHDFISIYNPTDNTIDLTGYKARYSSLRNGGERVWTEIALDGSLSAGSYYVIIGTATNNVSPLISFAEGEFNKQTDLVIDNKQYSIEITDVNETIIDRLGVDEGLGNELAEGTAVTGLNKHSVVTRKDAGDTDNNSLDFTVVDLRNVADPSIYKPTK